MVEFWSRGVGIPTVNVRQASRAEKDGYDGIVFVDSQNLSGDCYIALALAAHATEKLKLSTGVTNPYTRHPAVTASAIATVQAESRGRAYLGIGRGDSALAHLGLKPASVPVFEDYVRRLHAYLNGEEVPFGPEANVGDLHLANQPTSSRIEWIRPSQPPVPVDVTATGPKVIQVGALYADRTMFAVGADAARLKWGIALARETRRAAGLPGDQPMGAYINVVVHDDVAEARRLGEGGLSLFARFSTMHGTVVGPATAAEREVFEKVHRAYDMTKHSYAGSPQASTLTDEFANEFGIFGPPAYCIERISELIGLGLDRFNVVGASAGADRREADRAEQRWCEEVMPALRALHG